MGGTKIGEAQTFAESAFEAGCFSRRWCQLEDFETGNEDRTRDAQFDVDWLLFANRELLRPLRSSCHVAASSFETLSPKLCLTD